MVDGTISNNGETILFAIYDYYCKRPQNDFEFKTNTLSMTKGEVEKAFIELKTHHFLDFVNDMGQYYYHVYLRDKFYHYFSIQ